MACVIRSAAARGEVADLERARKGSRALRARCCSMMGSEKGTFGRTVKRNESAKVLWM